MIQHLIPSFRHKRRRKTGYWIILLSSSFFAKVWNQTFFVVWFFRMEEIVLRTIRLAKKHFFLLHGAQSKTLNSITPHQVPTICIFTELAPLGRFSHRVAMFVYLLVQLDAGFFRDLKKRRRKNYKNNWPPPLLPKKQKYHFLIISVSFGIDASICIGWEIQCFPYAGFFLLF